jgi:hypothetical protein
MRFLLFALILLVGAPVAKADVQYVNISALHGFTTNGVGGFEGNGTVWLSPAYTFGFGDTVDFGLAHIAFDGPDGRNPCTVCYGNGAFAAWFLKNGVGGPTSTPFDLLSLEGTSISESFLGPCNEDVCGIDRRLLFTLPSGINGIQLAFQAGVTIDPPTISTVPEASTWAMLLIGFAAIGYAYRLGVKQPTN